MTQLSQVPERARIAIAAVCNSYGLTYEELIADNHLAVRRRAIVTAYRAVRSIRRSDGSVAFSYGRMATFFGRNQSTIARECFDIPMFEVRDAA